MAIHTKRQSWGRVALVSAVFLAGALLHFLPVALPYKVAIPVAWLGVGALAGGMPRMLAAAFLLSACGDVMGAAHNFVGQMSFFALAHVAFIAYFLSPPRTKRGVSLTAAFRLAIPFQVILAAAILLVVYHVPGDALRAGVLVYTLLLCNMAWLAAGKQNACLTIGAGLFVVSDFILAYNKFNSPIAHAHTLIMTTYYAAQWLLYFGAARRPSGHS